MHSSVRLERGLVALVVVVIGALYWMTAAPFVLGHDNGEFVSIGAQGGVPHPSGFPGYVVWLRAFAWLPGANPAAVTAHATALLGAATIAVLYRALRAWGAGRGASLLALSTFAVSAQMWRLSTHAENLVYTHFIVALTLWACAPGFLAAMRSRAVLLGFLTGLGLCGNLLYLSLLPLLLVSARHVLRASERRLATLVVMLVSLAIGLLPYGYLFLGAQAGQDALVWGDLSSFGDLVRHGARAEYGASLAMHKAGASWLAQLIVFSRSLASEMFWLPLLLAGGACLATVNATWRHRGRIERWLRPLALVFSVLLAGPIAAVLMDVRPQGLTLDNLSRFRVVPAMLLTVFFARALHHWAGRILSGRAQRGMMLAAPAVLVLGVSLSRATVEDYVQPTVEQYLRNTLKVAPTAAVLLGQGDERGFGLHYLTRVLGVRRDVVHITPSMLFRDWRRRQLERDLGVELPAPEGGRLDLVAIVDVLMRKGRPVLLHDADPNFGRVLETFPNYPEGTLIHLLPRQASVPSHSQLVARNTAWLSRFELLPKPNTSQRWSAHVYRRYAQPFYFLASEFEERGEKEQAKKMLQIARRFEVPREP